MDKANSVNEPGQNVCGICSPAEAENVDPIGGDVFTISMIVVFYQKPICLFDICVQAPTRGEPLNLCGSPIVIGSGVVCTKCSDTWIIKHHLVDRLFQAAKKPENVCPVFGNLI